MYCNGWAHTSYLGLASPALVAKFILRVPERSSDRQCPVVRSFVRSPGLHASGKRTLHFTLRPHYHSSLSTRRPCYLKRSGNVRRVLLSRGYFQSIQCPGFCQKRFCSVSFPCIGSFSIPAQNSDMVQKAVMSSVLLLCNYSILRTYSPCAYQRSQSNNRNTAESWRNRRGCVK